MENVFEAFEKIPDQYKQTVAEKLVESISLLESILPIITETFSKDETICFPVKDFLITIERYGE